MTREPAVAAVVVAFNGGDALQKCVESLLGQRVDDLEIIVVDNASTDGSIERLEGQYADRVRVVRESTNRGYAAGANVGWRASSADLVAILNQDLVLMPDCLEKMREALTTAGRDALVTPKLVLASDPTRVNAVGNDVHVSGVAWCHGLGSPADAWHGTVEVTAISGAAFMAHASFLADLDGLEERYFMYMEDVDLSLRARLAGGTCLAACDAVAVHDWSLALGPERFALMERNRRALWRRFWSRDARTYPLLFQAELMAWCYALTRGAVHLKAKWRAGRKGLRLAPLLADDPSALYPVLARTHPYHVLFPNNALIGRLGGVLDRLFAILLPA